MAKVQSRLVAVFVRVDDDGYVFVSVAFLMQFRNDFNDAGEHVIVTLEFVFTEGEFFFDQFYLDKSFLVFLGFLVYIGLFLLTHVYGFVVWVEVVPVDNIVEETVVEIHYRL